MHLKYRNILALLILLSLFSVCVEKLRSASVWEHGKFEGPLRDLDVIQKEGRLRVAVDYNYIDYFIYRGEPMGMKYEMLQKMANELGVKLEFCAVQSPAQTFFGLQTGKFDLAAKDIVVADDMNRKIDFTIPVGYNRPVLVQRKKNENDEFSTVYIRDFLDFSEQTVVIPQNAFFSSDIKYMGEKVLPSVQIVEYPAHNSEELVAKVAAGEIDYTVCGEKMAILYARKYSNIDVSVPMGINSETAWAVNKNAVHLKEHIDRWLDKYLSSYDFLMLQKKYRTSDRSLQRISNGSHNISDGRISQYDEIIRREAKKQGWDWRLIASVIYCESQFVSDASSYKGAVGLMQLMPETARLLGVKDKTDPEQNIRGGIRFMTQLNDHFKDEIPDMNERLKFILASYNAGLGHVKDAQRLAEKYNRDPFKWRGNVDFFLLNKSSKEFFSDPEVKSGYIRGKETCEFVKGVLTSYTHYLNAISE